MIILILLLTLFVFVEREYNLNVETEALISKDRDQKDQENIIKIKVEDKDQKEDLVFREENLIDIPDLNRELIFSDTFDKEAQVIMVEKFNKVIKVLEENPTSFDNWLELGIYRKTIEDYEGSELAWNYAAYLKPEKFVVWGNLADLNALYIKNNKKAEMYYLEALKKGPHQNHLYFKIVDFYINFLNDKDKAINIVEKGIEANPNSQKLKDLLISLK